MQARHILRSIFCMSIQDAILFLRDLGEKTELRNALYACKTQSEYEKSLESAGYSFLPGEFEEAVNVAHVKCQSYDEADEFLQRVEWVRMVVGSLDATIP